MGQEDRTVVMYINPNCSKNLSVKPILILTGALGWVRKELPAPAIAPNSPRTGGLAQYTHNWAKITTDPWVLGQLSGHTLELLSTPTQGGAPKEFHLSQELDRKLEAEIQALVEKGAVSIAHPPMGEGFTSRMFVVPKKNGGVRPIIDLRELNKFIHWKHFKMEGIHLVKDLLQEGDWMVKIDHKDAYFSIPIDLAHCPFLRFQHRAVTYQFNCLPFGLSSAPQIFTKISRPVVGLAETTRLPDDKLYRRQPTHGQHKGGSQADGEACSDPTGASPVHSELRQVSTRTSPVHTVSGIQTGLHEVGDDHTRTQNGEDERQGERPPIPRRDLGKRTGQFHWDSLLDGTGHTTSTSLLQGLAGSQKLSHLSLPRLRHTPGSKHLPKGGAPMVAGPGTSVEWLLNQTSEAGFKNPNRRLTDGLGSLLSAWSLEEAQHHINYLKITSDLLGNPNLCRGEQRPHHPGPDRQQVSNDLCEQERRHAFCLPDTVGEDSVVLVHGEEDQPGSRTHTGSDEHSGRRGVSEASRQMGLETMPSNIPKDQPDLGTSDSRSLHHSAGEVLQLEIGPPSSRDRCLLPTVGGENVCQPTLDSDSMGSLRSESPTSHSNTACTGVEVTGVVPGATVPPNRPPSANTSTGNQHPPGPSSTSSHQGSGGSTGRMAHIRRSCQSSELSEEATKLLMASWRSKSQSSYNSLFLKWERWCTAWSRDPIHGPVGDIANFLAELFQEGYSYSSLNSYRSAISSGHTRIEGLPVGQHPVVKRILKGACNINPPKPRYKSTWRVSQVVTWLDSR